MNVGVNYVLHIGYDVCQVCFLLFLRDGYMVKHSIRYVKDNKQVIKPQIGRNILDQPCFWRPAVVASNASMSFPFTFWSCIDIVTPFLHNKRSRI